MVCATLYWLYHGLLLLLMVTVSLDDHVHDANEAASRGKAQSILAHLDTEKTKQHQLIIYIKAGF